jgi:hypothetical protein
MLRFIAQSIARGRDDNGNNSDISVLRTLLRRLNHHTRIASRLNLISIGMIDYFIRVDDDAILIRVDGHNPHFRVPFAV